MWVAKSAMAPEVCMSQIVGRYRHRPGRLCDTDNCNTRGHLFTGLSEMKQNLPRVRHEPHADQSVMSIWMIGQGRLLPVSHFVTSLASPSRMASSSVSFSSI